jgi:predicted nucleic acid-binding protein
MSNIVVLDSNAVIYHLNKVIDLTKLLAGVPDCEKHISVMTELEALSKPDMTAAEEADAKLFLADCIIEDITPSIKIETIKLRRTKKLRLPDAIITATALALNAPIISNDTDITTLSAFGVKAKSPFPN